MSASGWKRGRLAAANPVHFLDLPPPFLSSSLEADLL